MVCVKCSNLIHTPRQFTQIQIKGCKQQTLLLQLGNDSDDSTTAVFYLDHCIRSSLLHVMLSRDVMFSNMTIRCSSHS